MSEYRPTEAVSKTTISATLPLATNAFPDGPGYCVQVTGGAPCVAFKCTTATGTPVVKAYVKEAVGGDWEAWDSYQLPVTTAMASATLRTADTGITLTADDTIFVLSEGFYAVALVRQSGTSAALTARTCEVPADLPTSVTFSVSGIGGDVAHDGLDSGNPVKIGFKAYSPDGTTPGTAVAEGDRTNAKADLDGRMFVNTKHPRFGHKHLDGSSAYTDEAIVADPGDGFQVIITNIIASTGAATALNFFLEEGSTKIFGPIYLEATAGRGFASGPIHLPVTASTAVTLTSSAAIAQSFDIDYFIQAV